MTAADLKARLRPRHCRHYDFSMKIIEPMCAVGVDLSGPGASRMCMPDPTGPLRCTLREEWSEAESEQQAREMFAAVKRGDKIMAEIPRDLKPGDFGSMPCPSGCGGTLHYGRESSKGHLRVFCTTPDCFAAMS